MRIGVLVTLATLAAARDSFAQEISATVQAIPVVTRADPTAGRRTLTEGYLTQPVAMAHAMWGPWRLNGTLDLEGLTLERGELNTGASGEGYVDRRHPHAYVHELLAGGEIDRSVWAASLFAGRGFAPFGSDDPMTRPFEKYPVNHHLAQVLERVVAVGAVRYRGVIGELGTFNGDEPVGPGSSPNFHRFGDSWAGRLTLLPLATVELSASLATVKSPEIRVGHGLDQHKASVVARYSERTPNRWNYLMAEYAHTNEFVGSTTFTHVSSVLAEGAMCRAGLAGSARFERTNRPEEEQLLDPFRTPRPSSDLSNLGVSRWTTLTADASYGLRTPGPLRARPFIEVSRIQVGPGSPPGLFSANDRYGSRVMWMYSSGVRLGLGATHDRMGRYGAALPPATMSGMSMPGMAMEHMSHSTAEPDWCK
jgi:hypothetical protein